MGEISKKVQESRLKWYGHILRREDECVGKRVMAMEVPGIEGEEDQSGGGWIASGMTCRRENCPGRTHKTGLDEVNYDNITCFAYITHMCWFFRPVIIHAMIFPL